MGILWPLWTLCSVHSQKGGKKGAFRLTRTSQWLELKRTHVFSTGQLPNLRARRAKCKHLSNRKKKISEQLCFELLDVEAASKCLSLEYWKPLSGPSESPQCSYPKTPKRDWTNRSINQLQCLAWEGLKQPTRPIVTSVDETTAERLSHTKRKVPLFVFGQGALLEGRDWWKTNITEALRRRRSRSRPHQSFISICHREIRMISLSQIAVVLLLMIFFFLESLMFDICAISASVLLTADARIRRFGNGH